MEAIKDIVLRHLQEIQKGITLKMQEQKRTTSGRSVASLQIEEVSADGGVGYVLTGGAQWLTMQRGRGPGKVPFGFKDIIRDWIVRKGINYRQFAPKAKPERALQSMSFVIARNIMKKGTKLHRDHGYNDIYDTILAEELEKLEAETVGIISTEVDTITEEYEND